MTNTDQPIEIVQLFDNPLPSVWKAITDLSEMKNWFFEQIPNFEAKKGFKTSFLIENEGRKFTHLWEIIEVVENEKLVYNWKYVEHEGDSTVTFALSTENDKTKLAVITNVVKTFPSDIPEFTHESCLGGWTYFINQRLAEYLKSK